MAEDEKITNETVKEFFVTKALDCFLGVMIKPLTRIWKKWSWNKSIKKVCKNSEYIDESFETKFRTIPAVNRYYKKLENGLIEQTIYYDFIVSVAIELCKYDLEKRAASFGCAILDDWFAKNGIDFKEFKKKIDLDEIKKMLDDREKIYYCFFKSYDDEFGPDTIRVYYPRNGEKWIEWRKECCVDVRGNFDLGMERGFCRVGFDYTKIEDGDEKFLKVAYLNENREVFRFQRTDLTSKELSKMFWVR